MHYSLYALFMPLMIWKLTCSYSRQHPSICHYWLIHYIVITCQLSLWPALRRGDNGWSTRLSLTIVCHTFYTTGNGKLLPVQNIFNAAPSYFHWVMFMLSHMFYPFLLELCSTNYSSTYLFRIRVTELVRVIFQVYNLRIRCKSC